jgi:hypothetical protein
MNRVSRLSDRRQACFANLDRAQHGAITPATFRLTSPSMAVVLQFPSCEDVMGGVDGEPGHEGRASNRLAFLTVGLLSVGKQRPGADLRPIVTSSTEHEESSIN